MSETIRVMIVDDERLLADADQSLPRMRDIEDQDNHDRNQQRHEPTRQRRTRAVGASAIARDETSEGRNEQ